MLISGGGSALLPLPVEGISLEDKLLTTKLLSRSGATIQQLNTVRKHLSAVKGGNLAVAANGARTVVSLILSDVINDPLDIIASGPTVPNDGEAVDRIAALLTLFTPGSTYEDCLRILSERNVLGDVPANIVNHLRAGRSERYLYRQNQPLLSMQEPMDCVQPCRHRCTQPLRICTTS